MTWEHAIFLFSVSSASCAFGLSWGWLRWGMRKPEATEKDDPRIKKPIIKTGKRHDPNRQKLAGLAIQLGFDNVKRYPGLYEAAGDVVREESLLEKSGDLGMSAEDEIVEAFWHMEGKDA